MRVSISTRTGFTMQIVNKSLRILIIAILAFFLFPDMNVMFRSLALLVLALEIFFLVRLMKKPHYELDVVYHSPNEANLAGTIYFYQDPSLWKKTKFELVYDFVARRTTTRFIKRDIQFNINDVKKSDGVWLWDFNIELPETGEVGRWAIKINLDNVESEAYAPLK